MCDIHNELLGDMLATRRAIALRYKWYYHLTPSDNASSIRDRGLLTGRDAPPPQSVVDYLGHPAGSIICLNPLGTDVVPRSVQQGPFVCLALSNETLPPRLSLDWSHSGGFKIAEVLRAENPQVTAAEIFLECVKRYGSIVVYDPIPREALRTCVRGCAPHNPSEWPRLIDTTDDMLVTF
jgi:hypothetical protein